MPFFVGCVEHTVPQTVLDMNDGGLYASIRSARRFPDPEAAARKHGVEDNGASFICQHQVLEIAGPR